MTGAAVSITVDDREMRDLLRQVKDRMGNTSPVMKTIGEIVRASVERNFAAGGRPTPWPESGRVKEDGGQTLSLTGRLRRSFTVDAGDGYASVGTNVKYAAIHQFGGVIKPKKAKGLKTPYGVFKQVTIPARPFLMVHDEDWVEIKAAIGDFLTGQNTP